MDIDAKVFPKTKYENLNQETNYDCQGKCTCKYLKNRTDYDNLQFFSFYNNKQFTFPESKTINQPNSRGWEK